MAASEADLHRAEQIQVDAAKCCLDIPCRTLRSLTADAIAQARQAGKKEGAEAAIGVIKHWLGHGEACGCWGSRNETELKRIIETIRARFLTDTQHPAPDTQAGEIESLTADNASLAKGAADLVERNLELQAEILRLKAGKE